MRQPPAHVVKLLRAYDRELGARWNDTRREWEVTRLVPVTVYWDATVRLVQPRPEKVLGWPHWDLTANVMDLVRRADSWRRQSFGGLGEFMRDEVVRPLQSTRLERGAALRRYQAEGRREMENCLAVDLGERVNVSFAGVDPHPHQPTITNN